MTSEKLAKYEIGWWKAHHRNNKEGLMGNMAKLYELLFGLSKEKAKKVVSYRIKAAKEHDIAESLEDKGNTKESKKHWERAEELLRKHFEILGNRRK